MTSYFSVLEEAQQLASRLEMQQFGLPEHLVGCQDGRNKLFPNIVIADCPVDSVIELVLMMRCQPNISKLADVDVVQHRFLDVLCERKIVVKLRLG